MRPGQNSRRSRGRGNGGGGGSGGGGGGGNRRQNVPLRHQSFDSNGPDVRIRGTAFQVFEKYQALARDAAMSGDRILAENFYQHAEHYYRIIQQIQEQEAQRQQGRPHQRDGSDDDENVESDEPAEVEEARGPTEEPVGV